MIHIATFLISMLAAILLIGFTNELFWKFGIIKQGDLREAGILGIIIFIIGEVLIN